MSPGRLAAHNLDAVIALAGAAVFALAGWPLEGWFWAVALWAANRFAGAAVERRAAAMPALRGAGVLGASMLVRPWVGMLALFLITRHDAAEAISATLFFLVLLTVDIATRVVVHRTPRRSVGGAA